jgi:hypothetical protein
MIEPSHKQLSIKTQCRLLSISRSGWYYDPKGESPLNLKLMRLIDEQYLLTPYDGSRQMARWLRRQGYRVGRHRVRRLMALMGLHAIYQEPRTSQPHPHHRIYPYLYGIWRSHERIRSGAQISPTSRSNGGFSIWWRSWIGRAGKSCHGACPIRWRRRSALRHWRRRWLGMACQTSSTPIKDRNLRRVSSSLS